ncbi:hypothetical protein ES703_08670 [subsurface metagenome]
MNRIGIDPGTIIVIVNGVLKILAWLGWFSEADWPEELDEAQDLLKELPGVDMARLEDLRAYAHEMYLKHHHAEPWNKSWRLKKFQEAIRAWAEGLKEEAEKAAEEIGYDIKPWYIKYLPYGLMAGLGIALIAVLASGRREPRVIYLSAERR